MKRNRRQHAGYTPGYAPQQSEGGDLQSLLQMYQQFSPAQQTQEEMMREQLIALQYANQFKPEADALQLDSMRSEIEARKAAMQHQAVQDQLLQAQMGKAEAQDSQIQLRTLMDTVGAAGENPALQRMLLESKDPKIAELSAKTYPLAVLDNADQQQMKFYGEDASTKPIERGRFYAQMLQKNPAIKQTLTKPQLDSLNLYNDYMTLPAWIDQTPELQKAQAIKDPEALKKFREYLKATYTDTGALTPQIYESVFPMY